MAVEKELTDTLEEQKDRAENEVILSKEDFYSGEGDKALISEIILAQYELNHLKEQYGIQEEEKGLKKVISNSIARKEALSQVPFKKKTYILLACLLGWGGAHRFYTKQYVMGTVYLLLCWTGFSYAMALIDLIPILFKKPDENGNIYL